MEELSKQSQVIEAMFQIYDKKGELVDFKLNHLQRQIDREIVQTGEIRSSILKYRQGGVTSFVMAWFLVECMRRHSVVVMLAHDRDHTEKLLLRARQFLQNLKGAKPKTSKMNDNEITFAKTQSSFYIGTAGSTNFGRSATISHLHCSEIAFWKDPKTLLVGLHQAVPHDTGVIVQETTGNGWGTYYQQSFYNMMAKKSRYKGYFFPWYIHPEYVSETPLTKSLSPSETELMGQFGLTIPQIQWRREKVDEFEGDEIMFNQEYPCTVEDCFRLTGGSLFPGAELIENKDWVQDGYVSYLKGHPKQGYHYILGADAAGGTGGDNSAIEGLCLETKEQVLSYSNNKISPPKFAQELAELGKKYNHAYLVPETNSHGISVLAVLKDYIDPETGDRNYPLEKIYKHVLKNTMTSNVMNVPSYGYGWKTTGISKPYMVGIGVKFIEAGWKIYDPQLYNELLSFTETAEGKLEGMGEHDDNAISFMLACLGVLKVLKISPDALETKKKKKKPTLTENQKTWRDENGNYKLKFEEMFMKKGARKKSVHILH